VVAVLKQERYEIYQEALASRRANRRRWWRGTAANRGLDVPALRFSDTYTDPVRVVRVRRDGRSEPAGARNGRPWRKNRPGFGGSGRSGRVCRGHDPRPRTPAWKIENNASAS